MSFKSAPPPCPNLSRTIVENDLSPPSRIMPARRDNAILTVLAGPHMGAMFRLEGQRTVIGRGDDATICLSEDKSLSWHHACIYELGEGRIVEDLKSTNGTYLGLERVSFAQPLENGARIGLGRHTVLKLELQDALEAAVTERLYESMVTDPLTGARNRLAFDDRLEAELAYAVRHQTALSVIMVDIDYFKRINDTHGHPAGDAVLQQVVTVLQQAIRTEDLLARYGGEEFAIIARGITCMQAMLFADRLRLIIAHTLVVHGGTSINVTTSFGTATATSEAPLYDKRSLIVAADQALYAAKGGGRNRVVAWQPPVSACETGA